MATFNTINIYELNQIEEIIPGNYLIVQNENGTNIIDFKNFVVGPDNVSWYTSFTSACAQLTTTVSSLCNTTTFLTNDLTTKVNYVSSVAALSQANQSSFSTLVRFDTGIGTGTIPLSVNRVRVTVVGAGGAGGGTSVATAGAAGGGGASGNTLIRYFTGVSGLQYSYFVGTGGIGVQGAAGNWGADSSFSMQNVTVSARGGPGGAVGTAASTTALGGAPFTTVIGLNGDILIPGGYGFNSNSQAGAANSWGGHGAVGYLGVGSGRGTSNGAGLPGLYAGAGGGGGGATGAATVAGGNGANGLIILEY